MLDDVHSSAKVYNHCRAVILNETRRQAGSCFNVIDLANVCIGALLLCPEGVPAILLQVRSGLIDHAGRDACARHGGGNLNLIIRFICSKQHASALPDCCATMAAV